MIIREYFDIKKPLIRTSEGVVQMKDGAFSTTPAELFIKVPGTHGGFINDNGFFYQVWGMEQGYVSWFTPYHKPILLNHDRYESPLGRVLDATFSLDDPEFYRTTYGKSENIPKAHIDLLMRLTAKDAIEKVINGEYMTVSQNATCRDVRCSICDADITNMEKRCDHTLNSTVEGSRVFWKFGALSYKEVSFVNVPSDEYAKIKWFGTEEEIKEGIISDSWKGVEILDDARNFVIVTMDFKKEELVSETKKTVTFDGTEWTPEDISMLETLDGQLEASMDVFLGMLPKDATLSMQQRSKMPASMFCGPEKSFPVPDCAHVVAARRLIGRYKGPGDKSKILACVSRKAKSMGCDKGDSEDYCPTLEEFLKGLGLEQLILTKASSDEILAKTKTESDGKIETLTKDKAEADTKLKESEEKYRNTLSIAITDIRTSLGKIEGKESYEAQLTALKGRAADSLMDTLNDLRDEIFQKKDLPKIDDPAGKVTKDMVPEAKLVPVINDSSEFVRYVVLGSPKKE